MRFIQLGENGDDETYCADWLRILHIVENNLEIVFVHNLKEN